MNNRRTPETWCKLKFLTLLSKNSRNGSLRSLGVLPLLVGARSRKEPPPGGFNAPPGINAPGCFGAEGPKARCSPLRSNLATGIFGPKGQKPVTELFAFVCFCLLFAFFCFLFVFVCFYFSFIFHQKSSLLIDFVLFFYFFHEKCEKKIHDFFA